MGNYCCISSKRHGKYLHKPTDQPQATIHCNSIKRGAFKSPKSNRHKGHRQSDIDYYYDDYEELANASRQNDSKKGKKSEKLKQQVPRQRKLSNKSALSYYASDVRMQDGKSSLNLTQTTLLNTSGLDSKPVSIDSTSQIGKDSTQYRDNSKIINHLSHGKKTNHSANSSTKQTTLVNTVNLNNEILLNRNKNQENCGQIENVKLLGDMPRLTTTLHSITVQESHKPDLSSSSASSIIVSSSIQNSSLQSKHVQSMSTIDPNKPLNHIQESENFESEPNLIAHTHHVERKFENLRKIANRPRSSVLNQSLNETNRDLTRSFTGTSDNSEFNEVNVEVRKSQLTDDEDSTELNAISDLNWKKYRSLQKSKRSIKTIEETMKSSRSIEQWLNDFDKLEKNGDIRENIAMKLNERLEGQKINGSLISKRKLIKLEKIKRSRTSLDENDENQFNEEQNQANSKTELEENLTEAQVIKKHRTDSTSSSIMHLDLTNTSNETSIATDVSSTESSDFSDDDLNLKNFLAEMGRVFNASQIMNNSFTTHQQTCHKLFETVEFLMQTNRPKVIRKAEKNMAKELNKFLLPRSNANSDDIDLLRWLLADEETLNLKLVEPIFNEKLFTNDHMIYATQKDLCYLLIANSLRVKLVETHDNEMDIADHLMDNDYLDPEKIDNLASSVLENTTNEFLKFQLDTPYNDSNEQQQNTGQLILEKSLIETLLNKEKKLDQKLTSKRGLISSDDDLNREETDIDLISDKKILEQLRMLLSTSNFKGAQCLYNIKKKQLMNKRSTRISNSLLKKEVNNILSPISINSSCTIPRKQNRSNNSSGTTSPSSSSISPASSNRLSNNNTLIDSTPNTGSYSFIQCNESSNQFLMQPVVASATNSIQFSDLNERLFACFLSNFSCNLVDSFLKNSGQTLASTGFIRKKKGDKSFQFVSIQKAEAMGSPNSSMNAGDLDRSHSMSQLLNLMIEKSNFKLCLKLDKWPNSYQQGFFNRKRINTKWPLKSVLDDIYINQGLITYAEPSNLLDPDTIYDYDQEGQTSFDEQKLNISNRIYSNSSRWQMNTTYAESTLFKTLPNEKAFQFYYLYLFFMNINVQLSAETKLQLKKTTKSASSPKKLASKFYLFNFINERIFMHHYFRFLEIEEDTDTEKKGENKLDITLVKLINLLKKFSNYLNFILDKYKSLNRPNYFDMSKPILNVNELKCLFSANFCFEFYTLYELVNQDTAAALKDFDNVLNQTLINKLHLHNGQAKLKEIQNLKQQQYPANVLSLFNTYLDSIQLRLPNTSSVNIHLSPLPAHYSANTYLYEYIYEYVSIIFEQFRSKRDQFKISENLLLQLHKKILSEKFSPSSSSQNQFVQTIEKIDPDRLFSKFEEYAECVHKYLPQIRHNNQYLLFHYVWTMQVQYLAPFFNYLCDFYSPIE